MAFTVVGQEIYFRHDADDGEADPVAASAEMDEGVGGGPVRMTKEEISWFGEKQDDGSWMGRRERGRVELDKASKSL